MNLTNYHSHSTFCDGRAPMERFVESAARMGFESFGVSSHGPMPFGTKCNMPADSVPDYLGEAERLKSLYGNALELYTGMEIDFLNDTFNARTSPFTDMKLDFSISSVHFIADANGQMHEIDCSLETFRNIVKSYFDNDVEQMARTYMAAQKRMVELGGFDIVGHANKMLSMAEQLLPGLRSRQWLQHATEEIFETAAQKDLIVEMNTKKYETEGTFFPQADTYPLLREMGIRLTVNSDAHFPDRINSGRPEGLQWLRKCGFRSVCQLRQGRWEDVEIEI